MDAKELKERILKERELGNIVHWGLPGELVTTKLDDFIQQSAEGILYDLNRLEEISLTFLNDPRWVNDFATATVIRRLCDDRKRLQVADFHRQSELDALREKVRGWAGELQNYIDGEISYHDAEDVTKEMREASGDECNHQHWTFKQHGRMCTCGAVMQDFGD
jgi:hypothetical protein